MLITLIIKVYIPIINKWVIQKLKWIIPFLTSIF